METYVYDADFKPVDNPDEEKGRIEYREIGITHKWVQDVEEEGHFETVAEYDNGGKDVEWVVDKEGSGHWETYREGGEQFDGYPGVIAEDWPHDQDVTDVFSYYLYTPYTEEELEQIAADKAEAEKQAQIADLKAKLADSDYVITKISEYNVSGEKLSDEDAEKYAAIIEQRSQWRAQINELEA